MVNKLLILQDYFVAKSRMDEIASHVVCKSLSVSVGWTRNARLSGPKDAALGNGDSGFRPAISNAFSL